MEDVRRDATTECSSCNAMISTFYIRILTYTHSNSWR